MGYGKISKEEVNKREELFKNGIRICSKCKKELPLDMFTKDSTNKSGFSSSCKECQKQLRKERKLKIDKWFADNQEHVKEYHKKYSKEHAKEKSEYNKANKEYFKQKRKEYEQQNIDKIRDQRKRYRKYLKARYKKYELGAKERDFPFELSLEEFDEITKMPCEYCGGYSDELDGSKFNGIDRIDSSSGYVYENCVPCCEMCNRMKMAYDLHDFLEHIKTITNYIFGKET